MALTLKKINEELERRGHKERLERGDGYFYFRSGESEQWLDRTVKVPNVNGLSLEQWVEELEKLKKKHLEILGSEREAAGENKPARPLTGRKR